MFNFVTNENPILNPSLWIGNFEWREPITTLTDLLTASVCFYAFLQFKKEKIHQSISFKNYQDYFLFFSISMFCAAWFGHGLQAYLGFDWKKIGWVMSSLGFISIEFASIKELKSNIKPSVYNLFKVVFIVQFIVFVVLMLSYQNFKIPQLNSTITFLLFVLPIQVFSYLKFRKKGYLIIIGTIVYALIPGLIYNNQISFGRWFNYHDISHVLMAVFMYSMYKGATKLSFIKH